MERYSASRISAVVLSLGWVLIAIVGAPQTLEQDYALGWEVWLLLAFATLGPLVTTNVLWFGRCTGSALARDARRQPAAVRGRRLRARAPLRADDAPAGARRDPDRRRNPARAAAATGSGVRVRSDPWQTRISCRSTGGTTSSSGSATPSRRPSGTSTRSASTASPTPGRRQVSAIAPPTCSSRARSGSCSRAACAATARSSGSRRTHGDAAKDVALQVPDVPPRTGRPSSAARTGVAEPQLAGGRARARRAGDDRDLRRERAHLRQPRRLRRPVSARLRLALAERAPRQRRRPDRDRPRRRQRRAREDERVGRVLRARLRDDEHRPLRRRPDPDRVLGADEQGDGGRRGQDQVPDQRAGRGQAQEPDRRVPRVQRGPGRPAHRAADRRASSRRSRR